MRVLALLALGATIASGLVGWFVSEGLGLLVAVCSVALAVLVVADVLSERRN